MADVTMGAGGSGGVSANWGDKMNPNAQWDAYYAAQRRKAVEAGGAQGAGLAAAASAAGIPLAGSMSGSATGSFGTGSPYTPPATIASPSITGLSAAGMGQGPSAPGSPNHAQLGHVDTTAADNAIFAGAKDKAGQVASSSLTGLRSALGGRGLLGSGIEGRATASVANQGQQSLADIVRQSAITRANQATQEATTNYQGDITQRGQDMSAEQAANSLAGQMSLGGYQGQITQRGQDIGAANAAQEQELERQRIAKGEQATWIQGLMSALRGGAY